MFRDRRFLRCLRADALISPFAKPRFWHHVFDIPRFRVWHKCNREFEDRSSGDRVVLYLAQWDGWVRMEPFLGFFHQSSKSFAVAARRGHIFATLCLGRLRVLRAAVGLSFAWPATCSRRLGPKVFARPSRSASAGREAGHDASRARRARCSARESGSPS